MRIYQITMCRIILKYFFTLYTPHPHTHTYFVEHEHNLNHRGKRFGLRFQLLASNDLIQQDEKGEKTCLDEHNNWGSLSRVLSA